MRACVRAFTLMNMDVVQFPLIGDRCVMKRALLGVNYIVSKLLFHLRCDAGFPEGFL